MGLVMPFFFLLTALVFAYVTTISTQLIHLVSVVTYSVKEERREGENKNEALMMMNSN